MQPDVKTTWLCSFRVGLGFNVAAVLQLGSGGARDEPVHL